MQGEGILVSIADEGNGGDIGGVPDPGEPIIVNVDIFTGTNWESSLTSGPSFFAVNEQVWQTDISTPVGTVNATGKAFSITIDRNGAPAGSIWGLRVFVAVPGLAGPYDSTWTTGTGYVPFATRDDADGWQGVTGVPDGAFQYVPEPSSITLAGVGLLGMMACAFRCRKREKIIGPRQAA